MNVAIVGAGVLGRLLALMLPEEVQLTIIDANFSTPEKNTGFISAGMLCPLGEIIHAADEVVALGQQSLTLWPKILQRLQQQLAPAAPVFFQCQGSVMVAFKEDVGYFQQLHADLSHKTAHLIDQLEWLDESALHALEPGLFRFQQGVHLKPEAQLCNRSFIWQTEHFLKRRARCIEQQVGIEDLQQLERDFDVVIDVRGSDVLQQLPQPEFTQLRGVRGEIIRVHSKEVKLTRPVRVVHPKQSLYIVPKPNHEFVIGATEVETHSKHAMTVRSSLELLSVLYAVHPAFAEAEVLEQSVGIRAAYPDHAPRIEYVGRRLVCNGLYRHGWLMGPALVLGMLEAIGVQHALPD